MRMGWRSLISGQGPFPIPHPSGAAILHSGVQCALNSGSTWKDETMRMVSLFQKISKSGAMAARAHSLTFHAPARINRYPRIADVGGFGRNEMKLCGWTAARSWYWHVGETA